MQTYALCRFLKEHGYEVEIVDIRNFEPNLRTISEGSPLPIRLVKSVIYPMRIKNIFRRFYPALTKHYMSMDDLRQNPPQSDVYVVGSDQVWNHFISRDKALAYFLDFGPERTRRVSYASSFGLSTWEAGKFGSTEKVKECLDRFYSLSVREQEGQKILKDTFQKDATIVLDPTFLNESYPEISGEVVPHDEIVCYKLEKTPDFWKNMPKVAKKIGLPALLLNHNFPKKGYRYHFNPTASQWVRRIAGASFMITDSFHGVAFSIIYKRQFCAVLNHNGRDSRIISLLNLLHLENRMFNSLDEMTQSDEWLKPIDYSQVYIYLNDLRIQSMEYLYNALDYKDLR